MIKIRKTFIVGIASLLGMVSLSACDLPIDTLSSSFSGETSQVQEKILVDISVTNNKASYEIGESLNLTVKANYSDGSSEEVTDYEASGFYNEYSGVQSVTINYKGKIAVVNVYVKPRPVVLENITVVDNKASTGYEIDDELDIKVTANYSDGHTEELSDYDVTPFDNQNDGQQVLVVTYQDKIANITVTVNPKPVVLTNIVVTDNQAENGYEIGDELNLTVIANYSDGHTEELEADKYEVYGYDNFTSGEQELIVKYNDESYKINVTVNPAKLVKIEVIDNKAGIGYELDDELDLTVTAFYTDNSQIEIQDYDTQGFDDEVPGEQEVKVTFEDASANITVFVKANAFPIQPFEKFVEEKDVWVPVPVPYSTGEWKNGTATDEQFGAGFHAETSDKGSIDAKYSKVLEEDGWDVARLSTTYKARKANAVINFRTYRKVFNFDLFVTGEQRPVYPESFALRGPENLLVGKTAQIEIDFTPANANQYPYLWTSNNETVATVDENGLVNALSAGEATVTAYALNANKEEISASFTFEVNEPAGDAWTILFYICGADLESGGDWGWGWGWGDSGGAASEDIAEMLNVPNQPDDINLVIQTGGAKKWTNPKIDASKLCRFHADNGQLVLDEKIARASMGNPNTLESFINWGLENYPAEKVGLVLWNHGGGLGGVCFDENYSDDGLTASEVESAMKNVFQKNALTDKLEFIGYDACLMQVQDIAEINSKYFNYMIGSEESELGDGWDYEGWIDDLYAYEPTERVLKACCDSFIDCYYHGDNDQTLSYLDLSKMENYLEKFEAFAAAIKDKAKTNLSSFKNLLRTAKCFDEVSSFGLIDAYDAMNKIKANSSYAQYTDVILEAMDAYNELVVYSAVGTDAGKSYGLALHACVSSYCDYPASETNFNTWRSIFA